MSCGPFCIVDEERDLVLHDPSPFSSEKKKRGGNFVFFRKKGNGTAAGSKSRKEEKRGKTPGHERESGLHPS